MTDDLAEFFGKGGEPAVPPKEDSLDKFFGKSATKPKAPETPGRQVAGTIPWDEFTEGFDRSIHDHKAYIAAVVAPYLAVMKDYRYTEQHNRWKFFENDPNQGYKFHLNVKPENVRQVAEFLKAHDYEHKYLSGGEIDSGKVFTVYTGSKEQTERIVQEVADSEVAALLETPLVGKGEMRSEVPYAPNIVGRFVGNDQSFTTKIAVRGITLVRGIEGLGSPNAFAFADAKLKDIYGDYYGGGITFYQPKATKV